MDTEDGSFALLKISGSLNGMAKPTCVASSQSAQHEFHIKVNEYISTGEIDKLRILVYDTFSSLPKLVEAFAEVSPSGTKYVNLRLLMGWYSKMSEQAQLTFLNSVKTLLGFRQTNLY